MANPQSVGNTTTQSVTYPGGNENASMNNGRPPASPSRKPTHVAERSSQTRKLETNEASNREAKQSNLHHPKQLYFSETVTRPRPARLSRMLYTAFHSEQALLLAVREGDLDRVSHLLATGADVNTTDKAGLSALARARALGVAAEKGHIDIVRVFLQNRVNPNGYLAGNVGGSSIVRATEKGNSQVVQLLLEYGAKDGRHALLGGAGNGSLQVVQVCLDAGIDPNTLQYTSKIQSAHIDSKSSPYANNGS